MINMFEEELLTLREAVTKLPRRRRGRKPHVSTLWRWATRGLRGVRLEVIRVGGTLCTSREALQRFCEKLTEQQEAARTTSARKSREKGIADAEAELSRDGM